MPDHLHALITLPVEDADYSKRWQLIKAKFSASIPKHEFISNARQQKRERGLWQRRFWEHLIRNDKDYEQHIDYIHYNPVKHGYVNRPVDWAYSSIHRYIKKGILSADWGSDMQDTLQGDFGERD